MAAARELAAVAPAAAPASTPAATPEREEPSSRFDDADTLGSDLPAIDDGEDFAEDDDLEEAGGPAQLEKAIRDYRSK